MRLRLGQSRYNIGSMGLRPIALAAVLTVSGPALAEPLGKEACEGLVAEQQVLIAAGVKDDFAKGADWGKANLKSVRLAEVSRYLDVEEQLSFRCGLAKVRYSLPPDEETPGVAPAPVPKTEQPKTPPKAKPAPKAKAKAKDKAAAGESNAVAVDAATAPKTQAKPKPAAKPQDAFKPSAAPAEPVAVNE